ncbi:DUF2461 domain-containing protein [Chitinophagales bacterium]|nr:DUF2461 domain-containing protein [Chitinophagales bacterium]
MKKPYFDQEFLRFLQELAGNNNRDWFNENKERYIKHVKEPLEVFCGDLIMQSSKLIPGCDNFTPKQSLKRIYRDTRFSKDKTPYKLHVSGAISAERKGLNSPELYFQLSAEDCRIYVGCYSPDKDHLNAIRQSISSQPKKFQKIISSKKFVSTYGEIHGDKNKRIPKEFREAAEEQALIFNKGFYVYTKWEPELALSKNIIKEFLAAYKVAMPLEEFLFPK